MNSAVKIDSAMDRKVANIHRVSIAHFIEKHFTEDLSIYAIGMEDGDSTKFRIRLTFEK